MNKSIKRYLLHHLDLPADKMSYIIDRSLVELTKLRRGTYEYYKLEDNILDLINDYHIKWKIKTLR
jgi:hypothetical protein